MPWTEKQRKEYYHSWYLEHREERLKYFREYGKQKRKKLGSFSPCVCGCKRHYKAIVSDGNNDISFTAICMHCGRSATGRTEKELRSNWNYWNNPFGAMNKKDDHLFYKTNEDGGWGEWPPSTKINKLNYKENQK